MKNIYIFICLVAFFFISKEIAYAEDLPVKSLEKADIEISSDGTGGYSITQKIQLSGEGPTQNNQVEHTLTRINDITPINLQFIHNGEELDYTVKEENSLARYFLQLPEETKGSFEYQIQYELKVEPGVFTTPLFVPIYPAEGQNNVVTIDFETTQENIIQRNSFPILKKPENNQVTSYLMNIPSHVNYIYGHERNILNSYNVISWVSIFILLGIIVIWIRSELKNSRAIGGVN